MLYVLENFECRNNIELFEGIQNVTCYHSSHIFIKIVKFKFCTLLQIFLPNVYKL